MTVPPRTEEDGPLFTLEGPEAAAGITGAPVPEPTEQPTLAQARTGLTATEDLKLEDSAQASGPAPEASPEPPTAEPNRTEEPAEVSESASPEAPTTMSDPPLSPGDEAPSPPVPETHPPTPEVPAGPAAVQVRRLGDLLREVPPHERALVFEDYPGALLRGDVTAVPPADRRFSLHYTDVEGQPQRHRAPDELVLVDEGFLAWLDRQRAATRRALMIVTGKITLTEAALSDPDLVRDLGGLRREHLNHLARTEQAKRGNRRPRR